MNDTTIFFKDSGPNTKKTNKKIERERETKKRKIKQSVKNNFKLTNLFIKDTKNKDNSKKERRAERTNVTSKKRGRLPCFFKKLFLKSD